MEHHRDPHGPGYGHSSGAFVLSLDFELMWGVNQSRSVADYGTDVLGARAAVPRLLDLVDRYGIGATWATVGFLFFDDRDSLLAALPSIRPAFADPRMSNYRLLDAIGPDERRDPHHFGASLVREIRSRPRQEIATHTFSHLFCKEPGCDRHAFEADLAAAVAAASRMGVVLRSIVFPRNQLVADVLPACRAAGIVNIRGTGRWPNGPPTARGGESRLRRLVRLGDAYVDLAPWAGGEIVSAGGITDVPATLFFRPHSRRLGFAEGRKLARILGAMSRAARTGRLFHLWFHPHNIGRDTDANLAALATIFRHAADLRDRFDWPTLTMDEAARRHARLIAGPARGARASIHAVG